MTRVPCGSPRQVHGLASAVLFSLLVLLAGCGGDPEPDDGGEGGGGAAKGEVALVEFLAQGAGGAPGWVELYNSTRTDLDLEGCSLDLGGGDEPDVRHALPSGSVVPARGYFVLGLGGCGALPVGVCEALTELTELPSEETRVRLTCPPPASGLRVTVDDLRWRPERAEADFSLALAPELLGDEAATANDTVGSWCVADPTPGAPNHCSDGTVPGGEGPGAGELGIVEVYARTLDDEREWVEVRNGRAKRLSLTGCTLSLRTFGEDGVPGETKERELELEGNSAIEPWSYFIFAKTSCEGLPAALGCGTYPSLDFGVNACDEIWLSCPGADGGLVEVDRVQSCQRDSGVQPGQSLGFCGDLDETAAEANDAVEAWAPGTPSPGAENACDGGGGEVTPGLIAIVEVYGRPLPAERQWVEVLSIGEEPVDLAGCQLVYDRPGADPPYEPKARDLRFTDVSVVEPGERMILANVSCDGVLEGLACASYSSAITLSATMDESLSVICPGAEGSVRELDRVAYSLRGLERGESLALDLRYEGPDAGEDNDDLGNWCVQSPSPLQSNEECGGTVECEEPCECADACACEEQQCQCDDQCNGICVGECPPECQPDQQQPCDCGGQDGWQTCAGGEWGACVCGGARRPGQGELAFVEIYGRPLDGERQWVELYNPRAQALSLEGCFIELERLDAPSGPSEPVRRELRVDEGAQVPSGGRFVLASVDCAGVPDLQGACGTYASSVQMHATFFEALRLFCLQAGAAPVLVDELRYEFPALQVNRGQALIFDERALGPNPASDNDQLELWCPGPASPGGSNPACDGRAVCAPGRSESCVCESGQEGQRTCSAGFTWGACACGAACVPAAVEVCACEDGGAGERVCSAEGAWGACVCQPPAPCIEDSVEVCGCEDGAAGERVCSVDGVWGSCVCGPAPPCVPTAVEACACEDGAPGERVCSAEGGWGDCLCAPPLCIEDAVEACICVDGQAGERVCSTEGVWSACACGGPPPCVPDAVAACACPDGPDGERLCSAEGVWGACACVPPPACAEGALEDCACEDGRAGGRTCAEGVWGACICAPLPECETGSVQACACADEISGWQRCTDEVWEPCVCAPDPLAPGLGDLVLAELYVRTQAGERQWVEVFNPGLQPRTLDGCSLRMQDLSVADSLPVERAIAPAAGVVVPAQGRVVLARTSCDGIPAAAQCASYPVVSFHSSKLDSLELRCPGADADLATVDRIEFLLTDFGVAVGEGLLLRPDLGPVDLALANDAAASWCAGPASPGQDNACR